MVDARPRSTGRVWRERLAQMVQSAVPLASEGIQNESGPVYARPREHGISPPRRSKRIIVAGGGIGGLCCAFELTERGHDVTVLEAAGRPGGHVRSIRDPLPDGLYADLGAEHFTRPGYHQYWK